jgi:hypothetical protein
MAVERFRACKNIVALSRELGVHRRLLYKWRDQFDSIDCDDEQPQGKRSESTLRVEVLQCFLCEQSLHPIGGFFQRCLAKSRGSTPAERFCWREGIYDEIQEVMPLQGSLRIERMCQLAQVSRAGFYRCLKGRAEIKEEMEVRSQI